MSDAPIQELNPTEGNAKQRALVVVAILAYVGCFQWMYVHYLYPMFDYFGYDYNPPGLGYLMLSWILSIVPSLWMPVKLARPSHLAYWVLYITVFIPSMFVPLFAGLNPPTEVSVLMVTLFVGFAIVGANYLLPLFRLRPHKLNLRLFWRGFGCIAVVLTIWLVFVFRHHIQIVSFEDVGDLRDAANDISEGSSVNYAFMLLTGAINPFLMGYGLYSKRRWMFLAGALGELLVYGVGGGKSAILSILFIPGLYLLTKKSRLRFGPKLVLAALTLLVVPCLSYALSGYDPGPLHAIVLFVVLMRTLSIGGLATAQYHDFFMRNPLTYYSHIKGVSWFVNYPYKYPVGQEIGVAYAGTTGLDATAHFWATDGIGGLGLPGILLMSVLCALVFWVLDSAAQRHDPRLAALVSSFAALNLANISIFTTLLSGGLGLLILLLYLMPEESATGFAQSSVRVNSGVVAISHVS